MRTWRQRQCLALHGAEGAGTRRRCEFQLPAPQVPVPVLVLHAAALVAVLRFES